MEDCLFCSSNAVQARTLKKGKKGMYPPTPCADGMECSKCKRFACKSCLHQVIKRMKKKGVKDSWGVKVNAFLKTGSVPSDFIGHCCEWNELQKDLGLDLPPAEIFNTKFDGHLHFPEFALIVDSPFDCVDVHGLGGVRHTGGPDLPGPWHGVVSHEAAAQYYIDGVEPNGRDTKMIDVQTHVMKIPEPHCPRIFKKLKVRVTSYKQTKKFEKSLKGTNSPSSDEISGCRVISFQDETRPEDIDVDIITGQFTDCPGHETLLLCRFYKVNPKVDINCQGDEKDSKRKMDNQMCQDFFADCRRTLLKPFECIRSGGSSGVALPDREFFQFWHWNISSPRKAAGVKIALKDGQWVCVYFKVLPTKLREVTSWTYGVPRLGGQFRLYKKEDKEQKQKEIDMVGSYPFLYDFAETKLYAALILDQLNKKHPNLIQYCAVQYELSCMRRLYEELKAQAVPQKSQRSRKKRKRSLKQLEKSVENRRKPRQVLLEKYMKENKHTLVQHPVGYHRDVFAAGKACLENKVCFIVHGGFEGSVMGRGGAGPFKFVVAILDWASN